MNDAYERRALLLHMGDVMESLYCLSRADKRSKTLGEALQKEDSLAGFSWLGFLDPALSPESAISRATGAFFLWPKSLLDETLNRELLASTVQHDLFAGNRDGWTRYVAERREEVAWFGEGLDAPPDGEGAEDEGGAFDAAAPKEALTRWPWPDESVRSKA